MSSKDDNQLVRVLREDLPTGYIGYRLGYRWWSRLSIGQGLFDLEPKPKVRIRPCCGLVGRKGFKDSSVRVNVYPWAPFLRCQLLYLVLQTDHLKLLKASFCIGQLQSSLMLFISLWLSRGGLTKSYKSMILKLMCVATPKNPWVEHRSFQAGIKQDNPSAHPILPRSILVHLYPKETRRMPLQNLVSLLWINPNSPLSSINHYTIH